MVFELRRRVWASSWGLGFVVECGLRRGASAWSVGFVVECGLRRGVWASSWSFVVDCGLRRGVWASPWSVGFVVERGFCHFVSTLLLGFVFAVESRLRCSACVTTCVIVVVC